MILEAKDLWKSYGPVTALRGVSLSIRGGEIIGLVGDNGAGKSTFIKILAGYIRPDKGIILLGNKIMKFRSPKDARKNGIEVVYQDLALIPQLPVYRNIFLGRELKKFGFLDKKTMKEQSRKILKTFGIDIDINKNAEELSGGQRQMVAIARAFAFNAKLLLLDEPTAALSVYESKSVLNFVKTLVESKEREVSAIIVSHNIHHVYSVATRIVIMDHGKIALDIEKNKMTPKEIEDYIVSTVTK
ncbi:MAG: ATP-binding cassette domain-containing protein [Infirmifilum sp.]